MNLEIQRAFRARRGFSRRVSVLAQFFPSRLERGHGPDAGIGVSGRSDFGVGFLANGGAPRAVIRAGVEQVCHAELGKDL